MNCVFSAMRRQRAVAVCSCCCSFCASLHQRCFPPESCAPRGWNRPGG
uniref:Uncharacterized protein n=1 Tax=Arundo donax TaxID=35708 RepID=A0A0A9HE55_ARUDO